MPNPLLLILIGLIIGSFGTLVGVGGGFILVSAFAFIAPQMGAEKLTALSLVVVFFNAVSGSIAYAKKKRIDYKTGLIFAAASAPGAVLGSSLIQYIPRKTFDPIFGGTLILVAVYMFFRPAPKSDGVEKPAKPLTIDQIQVKNSSIPMIIVISFGVGLLSSILGIGGGIIQVPLMVNWLGYPVPFATATSQFVMAFMTGFGSLTHLFQGTLRGMEKEILCLVPAVIIGAQAGAALSEKIHGRSIIRILSAVLLFVGLRLLLS